MEISKEQLKVFARFCWEQGVSDFDEVDRNYYPEDRKKALEETWGENEDYIMDNGLIKIAAEERE